MLHLQDIIGDTFLNFESIFCCHDKRFTPIEYMYYYFNKIESFALKNECILKKQFWVIYCKDAFNISTTRMGSIGTVHVHKYMGWKNCCSYSLVIGIVLLVPVLWCVHMSITTMYSVVAFSEICTNSNRNNWKKNWLCIYMYLFLQYTCI